MDRDEQIRGLVARLVVPLLERNDIVAVSDQPRAHARLAIDAFLERTRNREGDDLLARAGRADRAGIVAAVARIERDDDVARRTRQDLVDGADRRLAILRIQVDDEAVAELVGRFQQETLRPRLGVEIEHDAHAVLAMLAAAHALEQAIGRWHLESVAESTGIEVEHDAVRIIELEQLVVDRAGYVEHGPRVVGPGPDAQGLHFGGRYDAGSCEEADRKRCKPAFSTGAIAHGGY